MKEKLVNAVLDEVDKLVEQIKSYEKIRAKDKGKILGFIAIWKAKLPKIIFEELKKEGVK